MKIYITVPVADWFEDRPIELDVKSFEYFTLECSSLLWTLKCYTGKYYEKQKLIESYTLSPVQNINKLIDELDIREIKSGNPHANRTIKSLFTDYKQ